ncbi:LpxI family protein [Pectinatus cerevisiiphilus]|uniref:DUF1009 domain-containing protein n=1 Tax=Pectinatus cerevisiiphilus TaxID=86956 RepID=A0A4R3KBF3_9FIRM|nr:UDP-2,3-diacylglucosamine diphosphatase LpxI [Pectinatus cerevisiiphilus]TCS80486.1 hypothetical protein EDC37_10488 [Pectinatus cerevisiiphilus]
MEAVGLLAGAGRLPVEFAAAARSIGLKVFAVGLLASVDEELATTAECFVRINVAKLNEIIKFFKDNHINKVTMLGKVTKELLFNGQHEQMDSRMIKVLSSLKDRSDDTLMLAFVKELAAEGIETVEQTALLKILMPDAGVLSKRKPTETEIADIRFGFSMAKKLGELDVGQTVVVKQQAVMALEAIEGTDACILRGGALAQSGAVVVKVAKPQQDNRFDVPAVGIKTIESMLTVHAGVLAVEAGKTIIVDKEKVLSLANNNGIAVVAL